MFKIVRKVVFNPTETLLEIEAPFIAKKHYLVNSLF